MIISLQFSSANYDKDDFRGELPAVRYTEEDWWSYIIVDIEKVRGA